MLLYSGYCGNQAPIVLCKIGTNGRSFQFVFSIKPLKTPINQMANIGTVSGLIQKILPQ